MISSGANNTRADGREFLIKAARIRRELTRKLSVRSSPQSAHYAENDSIRGAAVLVID